MSVSKTFVLFVLVAVPTLPGIPDSLRMAPPWMWFCYIGLVLAYPIAEMGRVLAHRIAEIKGDKTGRWRVRFRK